MKLNYSKKAQGLPLNTIVIAILVLIVLLVIVLFFTGSFSDNSGQISDTSDSLRACDSSNSAIGSLYDRIEPESGSCDAGGILIPGMNVDDGDVCCGYNN